MFVLHFVRFAMGGCTCGNLAKTFPQVSGGRADVHVCVCVCVCVCGGGARVSPVTRLALALLLLSSTAWVL